MTRLFAWPRRVIGVSVSADAIRAVGVRIGRTATVAWALEAPTGGRESLATDLSNLLADVPRSRSWRRSRTVVAVGPSRVQVKRLAGIPPLSDKRVATELLREGAERFFLINGHPLVTSAAAVSDDGTVWGAAFDRTAAESIVEACRTAGLPVAAIVPAIVVVPFALTGDVFTLQDGPVANDVSFDRGQLSGVRRRPIMPGTKSDSSTRPTPVPAVASLGERCFRFAEAYGAAVAPPSARALAAVFTSQTSREAVPRWRRALVVSTLAASALFATLAPGLSARLSARDAEAELDRSDSAHALAAGARGDLDRVTTALSEVDRFAAERQSAIALLSAITSGLPDGSAIVTLRLDSIGGTIVALAPRAATIVAQVERLEMIVAPEIIGPVTRETTGGRELERMTLRFKRPAPPRRVTP